MTSFAVWTSIKGSNRYHLQQLRRSLLETFGMPQTKTAFVGTARGELAVMVTHTELVVTFDLGIPQAPAFVLKHPLAECEHNPAIFSEMVSALMESVLGYLKESGVPEQMVHAQRAKIVEAIADISKDDEADRSGTGGSPLLEKIIELEPLDLFEAHFDLVEGMIPAIYHHVVTGTWKRAGLRSTAVVAGLREALSGKELLSKPIKHQPKPVKIPTNFSTKPGPGTLVQNYPSVRTLVRKFKPQQGKPLTGPAFVLVYDVNGRPIGVRSIKGPNWKGIAASSKCTRTRCSVCHGIYEHCRCKREFHDPNSPNFRGLITEKSGLCSSCSGSGKVAAEVATPLVVNTCPSCKAVTMNRRMTPGEKAENTRETCRECRAKAERQEDPKMVAGRELLNYIDANHWTRFQLLQGPSGSVYVVFKGPVSQIPRKIRISDHAMTSIRDPQKLHNSLPDLSIDPVSGVTLEQAKEWMKTAAKDMVIPERLKDEMPVYINPSKAELAGLFRKSDSARMALAADGKTLLAWDAMVATHGQLRDYMKLHGFNDRNAVITLISYGPGHVQVTDGVRNSRWEHNPEVPQILHNSPALRAALGPLTEIDYFDQDIVGDWAEMPAPAKINLTAASFGPDDIPKNFWVVLDIRLGFYSGSEDEHFRKVFEELRSQTLTGIRGVSETGQIVRQFGYRGAILRMPGAAVVAENKMSRVMYGNPHYLLSKNMQALYRLFSKDPGDKWGRDGLMHVLADYVMQALRRDNINTHAFSDLQYYAAFQVAGREFANETREINNIHELASWIFQEFTRSWHERYTGPTAPFTLGDIEAACDSALAWIGQVYADEGEWMLKGDTLKIPQGSTLIIAYEDQGEEQILERWKSWTPEQREFDQTSRSPWLYDKVLGVQKQRQMRDMLKLLPFKVSFISKPQFDQTISRLNNQKVAGLKAPKAKLFQETP